MKKAILFTVLLILLSSYALAENITIDQTRTVAYGGLNGNINIRDIEKVTGEDKYFAYGNAGTLIQRITNNFTTYTNIIATGTATDDLIGFLDDGSKFTNPHTNRVAFLSSGTSVLAYEFTETPTSNLINTVDLNTVTPVGVALDDINSMVVDKDSTYPYLYVLNQNTARINVYRITKTSTIYDYSYIRNFAVSFNCGISDVSKMDLSIYNSRLYLLCGDDAQPEANTVFSYNLVGDIQDIYTINSPLTEYSGIEIIPETNEFVITQRNSQTLEFYDYSIGTAGDIIVLGGVAYDTTNICIPNTQQRCTNATMSLDEYGNIIVECALDDRIYCSAGCENIDNGGLTEASCSQLACTNECNNPNRNICETPNTYGRCVVGNDGCLDLESGLFCPVDFTCEESTDPFLSDFCSAQDIDTLGLWTKPFITIDADIQNINVTQVTQTTTDSAQLQVENPILNLIAPIPYEITNYVLRSVTSTSTQEFAIAGVQNLQNVDYSALSCDFTNNLLEQDYLLDNDWNTSDNVTQDGSLYYLDTTSLAIKTLEETTLSQEIEIMIDVLGNGTKTITFVDEPYDIVQLEIIYDNVTRNLLIRDSFYGRYIVNETGVLSSPTDSLDRIVLINRFLKDAQAFNVQAKVIREVNGIETQNNYYSRSIGYFNNQGSTPDSIEFSEGLRIFQVLQYEQSGFTSYSTDVKECTFDTLGCKDIRYWVNDGADTSYHFYEDIRTCIQELAGVSTTNDELGVTLDDDELDAIESLLGRNLTKNQKLLFAFAVIGIVFGVFIYGYVETREAVVLIGGTIISGLLLLYLSLEGYVPSWYILILILVGAGFFVFLGKRAS